MLDRDLIVCEPWCGEECVSSGPAGKSWDFATARHWCSPECLDNRRRMHEGEADPVAELQQAAASFAKKAAETVAALEARRAAPAPAVEAEPPVHPNAVPSAEWNQDEQAGEPPEMTLEQALVAAASGAELQVREPGREWCESHLGELVDEEPVPYFAGLVNRGLRWRLKPKPAPALTRVRALAEELFENVQAGQQAERRIVEFGERGVREFGARLLQLIDGPAVDALKRALGQAEREFLGPGEGSR